jgi:hypothetical protein
MTEPITIIIQQQAHGKTVRQKSEKQKKPERLYSKRFYVSYKRLKLLFHELVQSKYLIIINMYFRAGRRFT